MCVDVEDSALVALSKWVVPTLFAVEIRAFLKKNIFYCKKKLFYALIL
jgi:hypothetical protein